MTTQTKVRSIDGRPRTSGEEIDRPTTGFFAGISPRKAICGGFWILAVVLGGTQAWLARFDIVNDTISYLDMGDYFFHGHLSAILNGMWSPLYAVLLGLVVTLLKTTIRSEYPSVHLLLFFIFLFASGCFEYFVRQLELFRSRTFGEHPASRNDCAWVAIAYTLFLWSSLNLIGVYETNPDVLVAALVYLACGLLVKIAAGGGSWKTFLSLGVVLALSYLTKSVMFPVALALFATAWFVAKRQRRLVMAAVFAFLLVTAPYIVALSASLHHFTLGESGRLNYAMHVDMVGYHHWQGGDASGVAAHPTHEINASPATYEFSGPIPGTYPAWYDPSYWYQGVKLHLDVRSQLKTIKSNLRFEFGAFFFSLNGVMFASLFIAFGQAKMKSLVARNVGRLWFLVAPCLFALALYSLVHYEPRYVAPFAAVIAACLFAGIAWADDASNRRLFATMAVLQLFALLFTFAPQRNPNSGYDEKNSYQAVAAGAVSMGLHPGDQIAALNFSNLGTAMWARLARVQIVAEVYDWPGDHDASFWTADQTTQEHILQQFEQAGAKAAVSSVTPSGPGAARWARIGDTGYYLRWLNK